MKKIFLIFIIAFIIAKIFIVKASADLNDGLVAYYPFNGNATDESGIGRDGTVFGATLTEDRFGNPNSAYHFDGIDDYIKISIPMNGGTEWSICCWINIETLNYPYTDFQEIISNSHENFAIGFYTIDGSLSIWPQIRSNPNTVIQDTHIFVCFVKSNNILKIYKNGQLISNNERGNLVDFSELTTIGMWNEQSSDPLSREPLNGNLDEVRIYDRVLSEDEIQQLYNGPIIIRIPEDASEGIGLLEDQGILSVFLAPETDLVINLSSDDTSLVTVPETVTIYADQNTATFDVTVLDNCINNGSQNVTITASASGYISGSDAIQVADNDVSVEMGLPLGWSIISLPVIPCNASVSSLFPEAKTLFGYEKGEGYFRVTENGELEVGKGYWILLDQNQSYTLTGQPILSYKQTLYKAGWEMIGGCTYSAKPSADCCKIGVVYDYVQGAGYQSIPGSEDLEPGKGYWMLLRDFTCQAWPNGELPDMYVYFVEFLSVLGFPVVTIRLQPCLQEKITFIEKGQWGAQIVQNMILTFNEMTAEQRYYYINFALTSKTKIKEAQLMDKNNNELLFPEERRPLYESIYLTEIETPAHLKQICGENCPFEVYKEWRKTKGGRTYIYSSSAKLKTNKKITLDTGLYFFEELTLKERSTINTRGAVSIYVKKLVLEKNAKLVGGRSDNPEIESPNNLVILAQRWDGAYYDPDDGIKIGPGATISGHIFAPDLKVTICKGYMGKETRVYGSILTYQLVTAMCGADPLPCEIWIEHILNLRCDFELKKVSN